MGVDLESSLFRRTSIFGGIVGGLAHASIAVLLWNTWFDNVWDVLLTKPFNGAYIISGMFLLGFVPVVCYVGEAVLSPAIIVTFLLILSTVGSSLAGPVRPPAGVPTPFALYILGWVGIVALAGVTARFEYRYKHRTTG